MNLKGAIIVLACCCCVATANAQKKKSTYIPPKIEDLPRLPIDTVDTADPETKLILYSNNTWSYYRPAMVRYDQLPIYAEHWDTTQIFSYKSVPLTDLPDQVTLNLLNGNSAYHFPIKGLVRSKYGIRGRRNHNGVDIPLRTGDPIYATFDGKVRYAKYNLGGYGNLVIIRHQNGLETWYAHLALPNVKENDYVKAGQIIGYGGSTGRSTGPHLHYEIRYCDQTFDPEFLVDFNNGSQLKTDNFLLAKGYFNIHSRASEILEEDDDDDPMLTIDPDIRLLAEMGDSTARSTVAAALVAQQEAKVQAAKEAAARANAAQYYTIRSGDTLGKIAGRYHVSIDQICRLNGINRNTILSIGRRLRVK